MFSRIPPATPAQATRALDAFHRLSRSEGRMREGAFTLEGTRLVERALRAGNELSQVITGASFAASAAQDPRIAPLFQQLHEQRVPLRVLSDEQIRGLTQGRDYGEILARAPLPPNATWPQPGNRTRIVLALVEVTDPGNVGALIRTALAGGADLCIATGVSDPWHPKAVRTSMGSIFKMPIRRCPDAETLLCETREQGYPSLGAATSTGSRPLPGYRVPENKALICVGSEAFGLAPELQAQLDVQLRIPMPEGVDSYSVNAAAAVMLYEFRRDALLDA